MHRVDAVVVLQNASRTLDAGGIAAICRGDVEFATPASPHLVVRGPDDVTLLFSILLSIFDRIETRGTFESSDHRMIVLDCHFGRWRLTDAMLVTVDDNGLVARFEPHLRPWTSSTVFILRVAARLSTRPGLVRRSLTRHTSRGR